MDQFGASTYLKSFIRKLKIGACTGQTKATLRIQATLSTANLCNPLSLKESNQYG